MARTSDIIASLQKSLQASALDNLAQFIAEDSSLDLSTAWGAANQINDSANAIAICKIISQLLSKVDNERGFASSGCAFIRRVLSANHRQIIRNLSSLRPMYVNPTLRMLITMSNFDVGAVANDVFASLEISTTKSLAKLLARAGPQTQRPTPETSNPRKRKRDDHSSKDITRKLFIELLLDLTRYCSSAIKAELLQHRMLMTELVKHLSTDDTAQAVEVIKSFAQIFDQREISRAAKLQFFNDHSRVLSAIYTRNATTVVSDHELPAPKGENQNFFDANDGNATSRVSLEGELHDFFLRVSASPGQGICFVSDGLVPPNNKKLYNPILASFLMTLQPVTLHSHFQLLVSIVTATPELIAHWTQNTNIDFTPRLDQEWITSMQLLQAMVDISLPNDTLNNIVDIPQFVLLENIIPSPLAKIATIALQNDDDLVKLMTCQVLAACMSKAEMFFEQGDSAMDLLEQVQKRMPSVEHIHLLALRTISRDSTETDMLLRSQAILLLSQYACQFEDLPRFDFMHLCHMVIGLREKNDTIETIATPTEQDAILRMLPYVKDLQMFSKRSNGKSIFRILVENILTCSQSRSRSAARILHLMLHRDYAAFTGLLVPFVPVCKVEALLRPLSIASGIDQATSFILDLIEDCFGRFYSTPDKYWDMLVEFCAGLNLHLETSISPIIMTIQEQVVYVRERHPEYQEVVDHWFGKALSALVSIGDNPLICQALFGRPLPRAPHEKDSSLFTAVQIALSLCGHTDDVAVSWQELGSSMLQLEEDEKKRYNDFIVDLWSDKEDILSNEADHLLSVFSTAFNSAAVGQNNKLFGLIIRLLVRAVDVSLGTLLDSRQAFRMVTNLVDCSTSLAPAMKQYLLHCVQSVDDIDKFTNLFVDLYRTPDVSHTGFIISITDAMDREVLSAQWLQKLVVEAVGNLPEMAAGGHYVAIDMLIAAWIRGHVDGLPATLLTWIKNRPFTYASTIIIALLESTTQELREIGRQILDAHKVYDHLDEILAEPDMSDKTVRCILEAAQHGSQAYIDIVKSTIKSLDTQSSYETSNHRNTLGILNAMKFNSNDITEPVMRSKLAAFHQQIIDSIRALFAEQRIQENKRLEPTFLSYLQLLGSYVDVCSGLATDVTRSSLNVLADVALENQSHYAEVLSVLVSIVQSTDEEAFDYARAVQALVSQRNVLKLPSTKSQAIALLYAMLNHNPKNASVSIMDEILKLYTGTLSKDDRALFDILTPLEAALQSPIGGRIKSWRLVDSSTDDVVQRRTVEVSLSSSLALQTIYNFVEYSSPVSSSTYSSPDTSDSTIAEDFDFSPIYDIRWALSLISGFMLTDPSTTMLENLISHHALGLAMLGLSSVNGGTRFRASQLLAMFQDAIRDSRIRAETQLLVLLDVLTASISESDLTTQPVPLLHAVFLALSCDIMNRPTHFLYAQINAFFLARPDLDMSDVPLFLDLFYAGKGYAKRVQWLLKMLIAGIRQGEGNAYARRHVLELCMGLYTSKTATSEIQSAVADLLYKSRIKLPGYWHKVGGEQWMTMAGLDFVHCNKHAQK